ncbi:MAG: 50S ribosomal protein L11 methyltransferase [Clostridiaceae bacterium]|nr:50S ribosomal protein L11 methyltransferase [Clostridiaceae bacterium]
MKYIEIAVTTTTEAADLVADVLFSSGAGGVSVDDPSDVAYVLQSEKFWDYVDEELLNGDRREVYVKTLVAESEADGFLAGLTAELAALKEYAECDCGSLAVFTKPEEGADWRNEWRKHFKPIVTPNITVVPAWIDYKPADGERIVKIEPGSAFGTGEHETTRLCLSLMPDVTGKDVLDVGCGSGILGISALIAGAASVYMCDIDATALASARENAALNGVADKKIVAEQADLLQNPTKTGDVIFANITADILIRLSQGIVKHLKPHGKMVLSGIIHQRLDEVKKAYSEAGLTCAEHKTEGEWDALLFVKPI